MAQITLNSSGVASNGSLLLQSNGTTTAVTIDTSQNLGLGVTPSAWYSSWKALEIGSGTAIWRVSGQDFRMSSNLYNDGSNSIYKANGAAAFYSQGSGVHSWYNAASGTAGNAITFTQAMTLDASGNLLVGDTGNAIGSKVYVNSGSGEGVGIIVNSSNSNRPLVLWNSASSGNRMVIFYTGSGPTSAGSIESSGSTTTYNTSSDYRLKNITGPITNSGAYIDSLNPVEGTWKASGSAFVGLIAHEVQEASRTFVATGVKDGEEMQGLDYSSGEIIANLIAEIQSLRKRLADAGI